MNSTSYFNLFSSLDKGMPLGKKVGDMLTASAPLFFFSSLSFCINSKVPSLSICLVGTTWLLIAVGRNVQLVGTTCFLCQINIIQLFLIARQLCWRFIILSLCSLLNGLIRFCFFVKAGIT